MLTRMKRVAFSFEEYILTHVQRSATGDSVTRRPIFVCSDCGFVVTNSCISCELEPGLLVYQLPGL